MKLSVALATFNEERLIKQCLEEVYDLADEIVIVDGTSTDSTLDIVKKLDVDGKVKITIKDNPPMFHINKQVAIQKCKGDWILQLDADEIVSGKLKEEIKEIISNKIQDTSIKEFSNFKFHLPADKTGISNSNEVVAYWIPRLNHFLGTPLTKGGQYPDPTIRLYKNGTAYLPCKSLHEQVTVDGAVGKLKNNILHYPDRNLAHYLHKWVKYALEEGERDYASGVRPSVVNAILYFKIKPILWFTKTYLRHRGYVDGFAGFVFALFSALRFIPAYIRIVELSKEKKYA